MAISTYSELKAAIADWLNRDDLTTAISSFISLAEADIARRLRSWRQEARATATISGQFSAVPDDWVETTRMYVTSGTTAPLSLISHADLIRQKAARAGRSGTPTSYVMVGGQFEFFPVPDDEYTVELVYFAKVAALSDAAPTNWLLTDAPDVYLYGALSQSAPYLKDDQRTQVWAALYQSALDGLNRASDDARWSGTGLVMRPKR